MFRPVCAWWSVRRSSANERWKLTARQRRLAGHSWRSNWISLGKFARGIGWSLDRTQGQRLDSRRLVGSDGGGVVVEVLGSETGGGAAARDVRLGRLGRRRVVHLVR